MSKKQISTAFFLASQVLPFLMITATFVGLAYTYGHGLTPFHMDETFELVSLSCNYAP